MHRYTPSVVASILALCDEAVTLLGYENKPLGWLLLGIIPVLILYGIFLNSEYFKSLFRFRFSKRPFRIPILDLYKIAQEQDWDFNSLHALDFADGLRQAGLDGNITMWGRPKQQSESSTKDEPLHKISADHWLAHKLDETALIKWTTSGQANGLKTDNFLSTTRTVGGPSRESEYADIHIDRREALKWLKWEAPSFMGRHQDTNGNW